MVSLEISLDPNENNTWRVTNHPSIRRYVFDSYMRHNVPYTGMVREVAGKIVEELTAAFEETQGSRDNFISTLSNARREIDNLIS